MKKPDMLILIAIWEFLTAAVALIAISAIAVFALPSTMMMMWGMQRAGAIFGMIVGIIVLASYMAVAIAAGIGLITGKEWGRITAIVHAAVSLFSIPIGTIIGILSLIYLTHADVKKYFLPPPQA